MCICGHLLCRCSRLTFSPSSPSVHPAALKKQLVELQAEVATAHERLHITQVRPGGQPGPQPGPQPGVELRGWLHVRCSTGCSLMLAPCICTHPHPACFRCPFLQARVEQNLQRISELKEESARLGDAVKSVQSTQQAQRAAGNGVAELAAAAAAAPAAVAAAAAASPELAAGVAEAGAHPPPAALTKAVAASRSAVAPGHAQNRACGGAGPRAAQLSLEQEIEAQRRRGLYSRWGLWRAAGEGSGCCKP